MLRIFCTCEKNLTTACYANVCWNEYTIETRWPSFRRRFIIKVAFCIRQSRINWKIACRSRVHPSHPLNLHESSVVSMLNEKKKFINVYSVNYTALGEGSSRGLFQLRLNNECRNFTSPDSPFCRCFHRETASFLPLLRNVWNVRSVVTSREVISKVKWGKVCDVFVLGYRDAATYCVPKDSWPV